MGDGSVNVLDLSQDFSVHTPAFASYDGPSVKWVMRLAFDKAGGRELTSTRWRCQDGQAAFCRAVAFLD